MTSRPDPYAVAGVEDSARLYGFGAVQTEVSSWSCRPQHAGLHALAAGGALHLRARKRDGRTGREARHGSDRAAAHQRHDDRRDRQAMVEPLADGMLRRGGRALRLDEAQSATDVDARWRLADRLGLRQRRLSDPCRRRGGTRSARRRMARRACRSPRTNSAPAPTPSIGAGGRRTAGRPARAPYQVELGDSDLPPAPVAGGSNTTASVCSAVQKACDAIRDSSRRRRRPRTTAARRHSPREVRFTEGRAISEHGGEETFAEISRSAPA